MWYISQDSRYGVGSSGAGVGAAWFSSVFAQKWWFFWDVNFFKYVPAPF